MSLRFLFGILAPGLPSQSNDSVNEKIETSGNEGGKPFELIPDFQTPAKFHIGMLAISLITGLGFGGFIAYNCWMEKNIFLSYIRNLVIALTCRTFFSIIFDGVILLESPLNVGGGNALLAFEQICLNLVLAFWLTLTIYIHARVQRNFNSEPSLRIYQYGVPCVTVFFALIWIFTLQDQRPSEVWWIIISPISQWIVNSINLLFILIQLMLVADIGRMMMKVSIDNDTLSLLRKVSVMMGFLVLIFWFQFGFTIGKVPLRNDSSYLYFFYFIDGLECALVCLTLYFFNKWVVTLLDKVSSVLNGVEESPSRNSKPKETLLTGSGGRETVTIDSVLVTHETDKWKNSENKGTKDVVYSNVVGPERLKKTLDLYKRFRILPTNPVTVVEGEKFYDCPFQSAGEDFEKIKLSPNKRQALISDISKQKSLSENIKLKSDKMCELTQKKNAFYSSKYLIIDSKESDFPKYLETRFSMSSKSGRENLKEERIKENLPSTLNTLIPDEMVQKWLNENSENMQESIENVTHNRINARNKRKLSTSFKSDSKISKHSILETSVNSSTQNDRIGGLPAFVSTINSVVSDAFLRPNKNAETKTHRNSTSRENAIAPLNLEQRLEENNKKLHEETAVSTKTISLKKQSEDRLYGAQKHEKALTSKVTEALKLTYDTKCTTDSSVGSEQTGRKKSNEAMASDAEGSSRIDNPLNHYLTYSELLEFRSKQTKTNDNQSPESTNNSLCWMETISSTIESLINASGIFFKGSKNFSNTGTTLETKNNENPRSDNLKIPQEDITLQTKNSNLEHINEKNGCGVLDYEKSILPKTNSTMAATKPGNAPSKAPDSNIKTKEDLPVLMETSERISHSDELTAYQPGIEQEENSAGLEPESEKNDVTNNQIALENETENFTTEPKHSIVSEDKKRGISTEITEKQINMAQPTQNDILEFNLKSNKLDITKNELILKNKSENFSSKHHQTHKANKQKFMKKAKETHLIDSKSDVSSSAIRESCMKQTQVETDTAAFLPEKHTRNIETKLVSSSSDKSTIQPAKEKY